MTARGSDADMQWSPALRPRPAWTVRCVAVTLTLTAGFAVAMTAAVAVSAEPDGHDASPGMWVVLGALFVVWSIAAGRLLWRTIDRDPGSLPVLPDPGDMAVLVRAHSLATIVVRAWPVLGVLGQPEDPAPVLEDAIRDLHTTLADRQALRTAHRRLRGATCAVAGIEDAVWTRRREILDRIRWHDAEVADTVARLAALVGACASHRGLVASWERANRLVAEADEVLRRVDVGLPVPGTGTLAEVTDRTTAAVRAYRDLVSTTRRGEVCSPSETTE